MNPEDIAVSYWPDRSARVTRLDQNATEPHYATPGSVGFDIAVLETYKLYMGEAHKFRTGLIIKPPTGHWTLIAPRSSLHKRDLVLANTVGIVDEDYCGPEDELMIVLRNIGMRPVTVEALERVAQGIFLPVCRPTFQPSNASGVSRGGFGSTGR